MKIQFARKFVVALVLLAAASGVSAVEIGSVTSSRFGGGYTLNGSSMDETRAKLLNTGNFGAGAAFPLPFTISDTDAILDSSVLANYDIFFIGWLSDTSGNAFSSDELAALRTWVIGGGVLIATCDDIAHDAVCDYFGQSVEDSTSSTLRSTPDGNSAGHPIFSGPFGNVFQVSAGGGAVANFEPFVRGEVIGVDEDQKEAMLAVERLGAGVVIYLSDINTIANTELSAGNGISNINDQFMGNLFAFAATSALDAGNVEHPADGGVASGIGVFSGWHCDAGFVAVVINGGTVRQAAYGTTRNDTRSVCGDSNNGWALLINFGLLGNGSHTAVAYADGEVIGSTTFTVTNYGVSFLQGANGDFLVNDFPEPGDSAVYTWSESSQNLLLKSYIPQ